AAAGRMLDIRVATLPTVDGEAVTMRLLDKSREVPTLGSLGLSDRMSEEMDAILARPTGALLVTGPTGSGKSTTLYAALNAISRPEINIITVEDPVEYRLAGVNQVQLNPRAGLRFARGLCPHCAEQYLPTFDELHGLHLSEDMAAALDGVAFRRRRGCTRCGQTGYRGRVGVFQLLSMSDHLEQLAAEKAPREEIERAALEEGMRTMWEDGVGKVAAGITSVEELARVCTV